MQLEAIVNAGATNCRTSVIVAEQNNENKRQIQRYIRLTYLIKPLLDMVDAGMPYLVGVELSYLSINNQNLVYDYVTAEDKKIDIKRAKAIRLLSDNNQLNEDTLFELFYKKTAAAQYIKLSASRIMQYVPASFTDDQKEEHIIKALEFYQENGIIQ